MATGGGTGTAVSTSTSLSGKAWTRTTLAAHLIKQLNRSASSTDQNAAIGDCIISSFGDLWIKYDWDFRIRRATMTLVAGTPTYSISTNHADFEKFDQKWINNANETGSPFKITNVTSQFESQRYADSDSQGEPVLALLEHAVSTGSLTKTMRFTPTPDQAYQYIFYYLCTAPAIDTDDAPPWNGYMHKLWELDSKWRVQQLLHPNSDLWQSTYRGFLGALEEAKGQNSEWMTASTPELPKDPCGDWGNFDLMYPSRIVRR